MKCLLFIGDMLEQTVHYDRPPEFIIFPVMIPDPVQMRTFIDPHYIPTATARYERWVFEPQEIKDEVAYYQKQEKKADAPEECT